MVGRIIGQTVCMSMAQHPRYQVKKSLVRATVNGGNGNGNGNGNRNGNGNGNGKGSSKLQATIVVQLKMEEIYSWYGP